MQLLTGESDVELLNHISSSLWHCMHHFVSLEFIDIDLVLLEDHLVQLSVRNSRLHVLLICIVKHVHFVGKEAVKDFSDESTVLKVPLYVFDSI